MKTFRLIGVLLLMTMLMAPELHAQRKRNKKNKESQAINYDTALFNAMEFRLVGPFRGGRATAVAGIVQDPMSYYMGATGGVWKTTDAGESWFNVSDGFFNTASVGAIAVAESDPNVVYVGMGEAPVRGVMTSHGDGMYKSTDGGKTWSHIGLEKTRHISKIAVDPRNPEVVFVAAQGSPYGATEDRGIYRSKDGGASWEKVHYVDENSGVSDLSMDMTNPRVIYAAYWDHRRFPWKVQSGGPGGGLWKSVDGGDTWTQMKKGLPKGTLGKMGISVSRAMPSRVWAIIEAENGGLYRSDDGGNNWRLINPDRLLRARSWYYMHIQAHPTDPESVYVMNAPLVQSTDGGKTFVNLRTRHGDNHQVWINPEHPQYLINANDGGANVSINGGKTWSRQDNQPTAQFYRVNADRQFPYRIYGGQQDNSSVSVASRANGGGIGWDEFYPVGGCESAYSAFDPDDPKYVYSGCYQGIIDEWNKDTRQTKDVMAYPFLGLGTNPKDVKYRFNWNAPIIASKHDPSVIYHAGNKVLRTTNRGITWEEISPDLTRNDSTKIDWGGGPITNEAAGGEIYHAIYYLAESPHDQNVLYTGADDGMLHVTRDGGNSWSELTLPNVGEGMINQIEVSPHDPGTVYVAYNRYKFNDFTPHIFKSTNYGQTWTRVVEGIKEEAHVRVIREDPNKKDLLYAGTETGLYVSFDGGIQWNEFQHNLPVVPITDLMINYNDLIIATQGRAFWVMDDLNPLYELSEAANADFYVYEPEEGVRDNAYRTGNTSMGQNPYPGFNIMYYIKEDVDSIDLKVEFLNASGEVVRHFATNAKDRQEKMSKKSGMNRLNWSFSEPNPSGVDGVFVGLGAGGHRLAPGKYTVKFTYGDTEVIKELVMNADPRLSASQEQYEEQAQILIELRDMIDALNDAANDVRSVRTQVIDLKGRISEEDFPKVHEMADQIVESLDAVESQMVQPQQKTFQDVINFPNKLQVELYHIYGTIDGIEPPITDGQKARVNEMSIKFEKTMTDASQAMEQLNQLMEYMRNESVPFIAPKKRD